MVEQPEPFVVQMMGPDGPYSLAFAPNADEGVLEARLPGGVLLWAVDVCERDGVGWRLGGLTRGTQTLWGDTYWFEMCTAAPVRIEYFVKSPVRTDYAAGSVPAASDPEVAQWEVVSTSTLDDPTWWERSTPANDLTPQFAFRLQEFDRPVPLPSLGARDPLRPTAAEALGQEPALAAYYRDAMQIEGREPRPGAVGYWLQLTFQSAASGAQIGFPWWDRVCETEPFFTWLRSAADGDQFFDADQGWILRAARRGERLHFQHGDLDAPEREFANLWVDRAAFLGRLDAAEADIRRVIAHLKAQLGVDPWS